MSKLLIEGHPLQVLPSLAVAIGLQEAIVLQQIHYWTQDKPIEADGRAWVFNSFEEWSQKNFPFWSAEACRKIFKSLRDRGLIVVKPRGLHAFDKVQKYAVNYEVLSGLEDGVKHANGPSHAVKMAVSKRENIPPLYTETTKETTKEITTENTIAKPTRKRATSSAPQRPDDVSESVWNDWLAVRKAKRAACTETALNGVKSEAKKAGLTLQQAIEMCCLRGWVGFKAEWLSTAPKQASNGVSRHAGFDSIDYRDGINDDGTF